jgi:DNA polymerase family A/LAGLIDADG-like domain
LREVEKKRDAVRVELMEMLPGGAAKQASMFGGDEYLINLNSAAQVMAEFKKLGIELEGTSEAELNKHNRPEVKKLLEYRSHEKTLGSFGEGLLALINPNTGRIHPDFQQYGADTGRFSCSNPNVQQIPATSDFRSCFIAPPGYKLITSDYSQAELRILAELSGDPAFLGAFESGGDLHKLAASQMFGVKIEDVSKEQRNAAKAINFGLAYGMGPQGLALRIDKTVDEARELIASYFKAFSGVQKWLDKAGRDSVSKGYAPTPLGRKRYFDQPNRDDFDYRRKMSEIERQGKNAPIQGCVVGSTRIFEQKHGYVPIESLVNNFVKVWDGAKFSEAFITYSGEKQLVKIELWGGYCIECSPDHQFLTRGVTGKEVWRTPADFKLNDRIVLTESLNEWDCKFVVPQNNRRGSWNAKTVSLEQVSNLEALGEWLGRLASDGSISTDNGAIRFFIAEHEEAIIPQLVEVATQFGHIGQDTRVNEKQPQKFQRFTVSSRGLTDQLMAIGVKQRVPDIAWQNSSILKGYLRGMFDGEGTVHPDGAILCFGEGKKPLKWAQEVQAALLLFGIRSRINAYPYRINLRVFKTDMPLFCEKIGFMNPDKQAKARTILPARSTSVIYGKAAKIKSVEFTDGYVDMYDVVNSQSGRFMANGLVVHNCNADMTKIALVFLREKLRHYDARLVNTVHDEIVVEVREDQAEEVCKLVEEEMVLAGKEILKNVPILAEAKIGDYWSK